MLLILFLKKISPFLRLRVRLQIDLKVLVHIQTVLKIVQLRFDGSIFARDLGSLSGSVKLSPTFCLVDELGDKLLLSGHVVRKAISI